MSPKSFLHRLGIKPNRSRRLSDRYQKALESAPNHPGGSFDIMNVETMDLLFADEQMAIETLGSNFDRLANSMERVASSPVLQNRPHPFKVCELGAGTGIMSMWLLLSRKCDFCEVVDRAAQPLAIGRKWATELNLTNISFRNASYADVQASSPGEFDFAFAEHGLDLSRNLESDFDSPRNDGLRNSSEFLETYFQIVGAISRTLRAGGIGLIGHGTATPSSLDLLCNALRHGGLAIDWKLTSNRDGLQLYVRPNGPRLMDSTEDESLAILADAHAERKVSPPEGRSLQKIFRTGIKYLEVSSETEDVKFKCSIFQSAGLACLFQRNSKGYEAVTIFSAAKLCEWSNNALRDAKSRKITHTFVDARLAPLLEG